MAGFQNNISASQRFSTELLIRIDPATDNQKPATDNQKPTTKNQKPTTDNKQPTTNNKQPTTKNPQSFPLSLRCFDSVTCCHIAFGNIS